MSSQNTKLSKSEVSAIEKKGEKKNMQTRTNQRLDEIADKIKQQNGDLSKKVQKSAGELKERAQNNMQEVGDKIKRGAQGASQKIQKVAEDAKQSAMSKGEQMKKNLIKNVDEFAQLSNKENGDDHYKSAEAEIRSSLKKGHNDLSSQLQKAYQGMLKNCIKQSEDEPHKIQKCWQEFQIKMRPVFSTLSQKSIESGASLKKCFESKRGARECIKQGIDFGQKSLNDASNALKTYLA